MSLCRIFLGFNFRIYNNLFYFPHGPFFLIKRHILQCISFFLLLKFMKHVFYININCTNCWNPRISKNNIQIIHINDTKFRMQHKLIPSELQIFKKLNTLIINPFYLDILCSSLQSINQLNTDLQNCWQLGLIENIIFSC
jgi:hypothetical protein